MHSLCSIIYHIYDILTHLLNVLHYIILYVLAFTYKHSIILLLCIFLSLSPFDWTVFSCNSKNLVIMSDIVYRKWEDIEPSDSNDVSQHVGPSMTEESKEKEFIAKLKVVLKGRTEPYEEFKRVS